MNKLYLVLINLSLPVFLVGGGNVMTSEEAEAASILLSMRGSASAAGATQTVAGVKRASNAQSAGHVLVTPPEVKRVASASHQESAASAAVKPVVADDAARIMRNMRSSIRTFLSQVSKDRLAEASCFIFNDKKLFPGKTNQKTCTIDACAYHLLRICLTGYGDYLADEVEQLLDVTNSSVAAGVCITNQEIKALLQHYSAQFPILEQWCLFFDLKKRGMTSAATTTTTMIMAPTEETESSGEDEGREATAQQRGGLRLPGWGER